MVFLRKKKNPLQIKWFKGFLSCFFFIFQLKDATSEDFLQDVSLHMTLKLLNLSKLRRFFVQPDDQMAQTTTCLLHWSSDSGDNLPHFSAHRTHLSQSQITSSLSLGWKTAAWGKLITDRFTPSLTSVDFENISHLNIRHIYYSESLPQHKTSRHYTWPDIQWFNSLQLWVGYCHLFLMHLSEKVYT